MDLFEESGSTGTESSSENFNQQEINNFVSAYFDSIPDLDETELSDSEEGEVDQLVGYVRSNVSRVGYVLTLSKSFVFLAQRVSDGGDQDEFEPDLTKENIFDRYDLADDAEITLSLMGPNGKAGIRQTEDGLIDLYNSIGLTGVHGSAPHSSENWERHDNMLVRAFRLSHAGRLVALKKLFELGLDVLLENTAYAGNENPRVFEKVISDYPRGGVSFEPGGMALQGITYGYIKADRPHLSLLASKVRTGSARQRRLGDIDGYLDLKVEVSVEVKDKHVDESIRGGELSSFVELINSNNVHGLVVAPDINPETREALEESGVKSLTVDEMSQIVERWDWPKQDAALRGFFHYLAHIEQNPKAVKRLQRFVHDIAPEHDTLERFDPQS